MGVLFYIWLMIMIVTVIIEIASTDLTSFWFSIGSFFALVLNLFVQDNYVWLQILVFSVISILSIIFLRPILKKKLEVPKFSTNVDSMIGKKVLVTSEIKESTIGAVKFEGIEWSAITNSEDVISPGEMVEICEVVGNKLRVRK